MTAQILPLRLGGKVSMSQEIQVFEKIDSSGLIGAAKERSAHLKDYYREECTESILLDKLVTALEIQNNAVMTGYRNIPFFKEKFPAGSSQARIQELFLSACRISCPLFVDPHNAPAPSK